MRAVGDGKRPPCVAAVRRVSECRAGAERYVGEVEMIDRRQPGDRAGEVLRVEEFERAGAAGREGHASRRGAEQIERGRADDAEIAAALTRGAGRCRVDLQTDIAADGGAGEVRGISGEILDGRCRGEFYSADHEVYRHLGAG